MYILGNDTGLKKIHGVSMRYCSTMGKNYYTFENLLHAQLWFAIVMKSTHMKKCLNFWMSKIMFEQLPVPVVLISRYTNNLKDFLIGLTVSGKKFTMLKETNIPLLQRMACYKSNRDRSWLNWRPQKKSKLNHPKMATDSVDYIVRAEIGRRKLCHLLKVFVLYKR